MLPLRTLFVDDEPNIRLTLPTILRQQGFDVRDAASVREALVEINSHTFDVLISDLNLGDPRDGFTVISAMRRIQPNCVNFILTGSAVFGSALRTLRRDVDGFFVKPADIQKLIERIKSRIAKTHRGHSR